MSTKHRHNKRRTKASGTKRNFQAKSAKAISQVRIIGGQFKRQWVPFIDADGLRPSPDRLRETLFNWLQFELYDTRVLDLCAGSGVLGFEALSRGARHVTFIEQQPQQIHLITQTAQKLSLAVDCYEILLGNALTVMAKLTPSSTDPEHPLLDHISLLQNNNKINKVKDAATDSNTLSEIIDNFSVSHNIYQVVFIDPPYNLNLWVPLLNGLIKHQLINSSSLIYIEDKRELSKTLSDFNLQYSLLKSTKVGQIVASLIQIQL